MALNEYLFGKIANFIKVKKEKSLTSSSNAVLLQDLKPRLTLLARAITGNPIEIFEAKKEGGYKNHNFFLPSIVAEFKTFEQNLFFYLYRILYLSVQKRLDINWISNTEHTLKESQSESIKKSPLILKYLFKEYPIIKSYYLEFVNQIDSKSNSKKQSNYTFLYGKLMHNQPDSKEKKQLKNFNDKAKKAIKNEIKTILKAKPVEEIITLEVDKKQQEDYVMTHNFEKIDTAEEHDGGWRDFDGEDELDKHSKALDELNMKYTVRVDDTTHSVYQADFTESTTVAESSEVLNKEFHYTYDEWNYKKRVYKENFCRVYPKIVTDTDIAYYKKTILKNKSTLLGLRKMLTNVNNKLQQQRRQPHGDEFDIDALTDFYIDVKSGHTPSEKVYLSKRKKEKDISILLLLDTSLSSDSYAAGNRVIDVEKQVSILFGEILNEFNVDFAIQSFHSKTRNFTTYQTIKNFGDDWDKSKYKIGPIQPEGYTRIGAALRHSGTLLEKRDSKNKWVILISDGKPNDYDRYEGKYGINDVKQSLRELNKLNINTYALAIEAQAKYYLPQMFGQNHYNILTTPVELLNSLVKLYEKIKHFS